MYGCECCLTRLDGGNDIEEQVRQEVERYAKEVIPSELEDTIRRLNA